SRANEIGLRVPQVREVTKIAGKWTIVSEYIRGQTLGQLIKTRPNRVEEYMRLLFDTQKEIHSKIGADGKVCMCHGDFEPSNIVVSDDGNPYTIDWAKAEYGEAFHDCAVTYLLLLLSGEDGCAEIYLNFFENKEQLREHIPSAARALICDANERRREFLRSFL
ncbi:MAG: phosphotransferase, partial [bacterium]|nr:phosphotransferase [bacterium]